MERPLEFILQEEQMKLFFHELIQHIESKGFVQKILFTIDEGVWSERLLHYQFVLSHGYTEIEIDTSSESVFVILFEYSSVASINNWHHMDMPKEDYNPQKVLEELNTHTKLVNLV